jgi:GON domain
MRIARISFHGALLALTATALACSGPDEKAPADPVASTSQPWETMSGTDETQSTHMWMADSGLKILRDNNVFSSGSNAAALVNELIDPTTTCGAQWRQAINDADYLPEYTDGVAANAPDPIVGVAAFLLGGWRSHFYDPDSGENYWGEANPTAYTQAKLHFDNAIQSAANLGVLTASACYELGLSLHYMSDVTQPMHAVNFTNLDAPQLFHGKYEEWAMNSLQPTVAQAPWVDLGDLDGPDVLRAAAVSAKGRWPTIMGRIATVWSGNWQGDPILTQQTVGALTSGMQYVANYLRSFVEAAGVFTGAYVDTALISSQSTSMSPLAGPINYAVIGCAGNELAVGIYGTYSNNNSANAIPPWGLDSIGFYCVTPGADGSWSNPRQTGTVGGAGPVAYNYQCPAGNAISGLQGNLGYSNAAYNNLLGAGALCRPILAPTASVTTGPVYGPTWVSLPVSSCSPTQLASRFYVGSTSGTFSAIYSVEAACLDPRDILPGVDGSTCQALKDAGIAAADGEFAITTSGHTMSIYCYNVQGTPKEYLTLPRQGNGRNVSRYGGSLTTTYTRVRFHPDTFAVDWTDTTFSTSTGSYTNGNTTSFTLGFGEAADCSGNGSASGVSNIDLSGTGLGVAASQFVVNGYNPAGVTTYSGHAQIVDLTGGGNCGWNGPPTSQLQLEWVGTDTWYPRSCADVLAGNPAATDGEYTLDVSGQPMSIYCRNMASTPVEYLTLPHTGGANNYSHYGAGNTSPTGLTTSFTKIRFHPDTLVVDWGDTTFSTSTGSANFGGGSTVTTSMGFGAAVDCAGQYSASGTADINLTGTFLAVANSQFVVNGWRPGGGTTYSASNQTVTLTGGGYCGSNEPPSSQLLLMLATTGSCAEAQAVMTTQPVDGEYTLYAGHDYNRPFTAYCYNMATSTPTEYLTLHNTASGANYSEEVAGGAIAGTNVVSAFTKVRIDPQSMRVDTTDHTFSSSTGLITTWGLSTMPYAQAGACVGASVAAGRANVDLTGTAFGVAPGAFASQGWEAAGSATYSSNNQIVNLAGGGWCGDEGVPDGVHLQLSYIGE